MILIVPGLLTAVHRSSGALDPQSFGRASIHAAQEISAPESPLQATLAHAGSQVQVASLELSRQ
jgi:hypothetical protein